MVVKGGAMQTSHNTHERTAVLSAPSPHTPLSGQLRPFQCSFHEFQTKSQASPCTESFFKRLINLLGMSQER